jgi:hypothetical protein
MFNRCSELLEQNLDDQAIELLQQEKTKNQESLYCLISMNNYHLFNRAICLGSGNVIAFILSAYEFHCDLISHNDFKLFKTLIEDKRYNDLSLILRHINEDCRNMLFDKFGDFIMSLCHVQSNLIQYYQENEPFSYCQRVDIIKAVIPVACNKPKQQWLMYYLQHNPWDILDLLTFLKIAIRFGNIEVVKIIETHHEKIIEKLLLPENSNMLVDAGRHQKIFSYLLSKIVGCEQQLQDIFLAHDYAWLHAIVETSNSAFILSTVLGFFQTPNSRTLAITSRDNRLYDFAYLKNNRDIMEILLSEPHTYQYALQNFKSPKCDDKIPALQHLRHLLFEAHIRYGQGEISKAEVKSLLSSFSVDQKRYYFKLSIEQRNASLLNELYLSIQMESSLIIMESLKQEIMQLKQLYLVKFLMGWNQQLILKLLTPDLSLFFEHSISNNLSPVLTFLHDNFLNQFQDYFKHLTNWLNVVSHFSVDIFQQLVDFIHPQDIETVLKQDNYELFNCVYEKTLNQMAKWNSLKMLEILMTKFPHLRVEMVTSRQCISAGIQARNSVAVRTLLYQDKTIFYAVVQQLFESNKKDELFLLIGLITSEKKFFSSLDYKNPVQLKPKHRDDFISLCKKFKRPREDNLQSEAKLTCLSN